MDKPYLLMKQYAAHPAKTFENVTYRIYDEYANYPATFVEAHPKKEEDDMTRYFVVDGNIIECEVPKKWHEAVQYDAAYRDGFEDGVDARQKDGELGGKYDTRLAAEAYVAGYEAGKDATS